MRKLWTEERVTFEGEYYKTHDATIYDRPTEPIPIYIAGGPQVAKYGRSGEGFICTSGKGTELYRDKLIPAAVLEGMEAAKKLAGSVDYMIEMKVSFDTDMARAKEDTRFWSALALSADEKTSTHNPTEMARLHGRPADRSWSPAAGSSLTDPGGGQCRADRALRRAGLRPPACSTRPVPTRPASSISTPRKSCCACASALGDVPRTR